MFSHCFPEVLCLRNFLLKIDEVSLVQCLVDVQVLYQVALYDIFLGNLILQRKLHKDANMGRHFCVFSRFLHVFPHVICDFETYDGKIQCVFYPPDNM